MTRHHPDDALLTAIAAGALAPGPRLVVSAHVERCARCRARLRDYEEVGGVLLDTIEPLPLPAGALGRMLARIDAAPALAPPAAPVPAAVAAAAPADPESRWRASLPPGASWPRSLRGSSIEPWRRLGRHVRFSRVTPAGSAIANVYLLRVAAGRGLPVHGHRGGEVTVVLHGSYDDGGQRFTAGDFEAADDRTHHRPVVATDGECICLTSVEGRVAFDGPVARLVGSLFRM